MLRSILSVGVAIALTAWGMPGRATEDRCLGVGGDVLSDAEPFAAPVVPIRSEPLRPRRAKPGASVQANASEPIESENAPPPQGETGPASGLDVSYKPLPTTEKPSSALRTAGWVTVGVGAVGVVAGLVAGSSASKVREHLDQRCIDRRCPGSEADTIDRYEFRRLVYRAGVGAGLGAVALGGVLVLLAPDGSSSKAESHAAARTRPYVWTTGTAAGIGGAF